MSIDAQREQIIAQLRKPHAEIAEQFSEYISQTKQTHENAKARALIQAATVTIAAAGAVVAAVPASGLIVPASLAIGSISMARAAIAHFRENATDSDNEKTMADFAKMQTPETIAQKWARMKQAIADKFGLVDNQVDLDEPSHDVDQSSAVIQENKQIKIQAGVEMNNDPDQTEQLDEAATQAFLDQQEMSRLAAIAADPDYDDQLFQVDAQPDSDVAPSPVASTPDSAPEVVVQEVAAEALNPESVESNPGDQQDANQEAEEESTIEPEPQPEPEPEPEPDAIVGFRSDFIVLDDDSAILDNEQAAQHALDSQIFQPDLNPQDEQHYHPEPLTPQPTQHQVEPNFAGYDLIDTASTPSLGNALSVQEGASISSSKVPAQPPTSYQDVTATAVGEVIPASPVNEQAGKIDFSDAEIVDVAADVKQVDPQSPPLDQANQAQMAAQPHYAMQPHPQHQYAMHQQAPHQQAGQFQSGAIEYGASAVANTAAGLVGAVGYGIGAIASSAAHGLAKGFSLFNRNTAQAQAPLFDARDQSSSMRTNQNQTVAINGDVNGDLTVGQQSHQQQNSHSPQHHSPNIDEVQIDLAQEFVEAVEDFNVNTEGLFEVDSRGNYTNSSMQARAEAEKELERVQSHQSTPEEISAAKAELDQATINLSEDPQFIATQESAQRLDELAGNEAVKTLLEQRVQENVESGEVTKEGAELLQEGMERTKNNADRFNKLSQAVTDTATKIAESIKEMMERIAKMLTSLFARKGNTNEANADHQKQASPEPTP